MIWKNALKYPVLAIGVILFVLFLTDPKTKKWLKKYSGSRIPNTCRSVMEKVEKKAPDNWEMECPGTQLLKIAIEHNSRHTNILSLRPEMYKNLANSYVKLAQLSNPETLAGLKYVKMKLINEQLTIDSKTDGQAVVELLKRKTPQAIAEHLKLTVKVKEIRE